MSSRNGLHRLQRCTRASTCSLWSQAGQHRWCSCLPSFSTKGSTRLTESAVLQAHFSSARLDQRVIHFKGKNVTCRFTVLSEVDSNITFLHHLVLKKENPHRRKSVRILCFADEFLDTQPVFSLTVSLQKCRESLSVSPSQCVQFASLRDATACSPKHHGRMVPEFSLYRLRCSP